MLATQPTVRVNSDRTHVGHIALKWHGRKEITTNYRTAAVKLHQLGKKYNNQDHGTKF